MAENKNESINSKLFWWSVANTFIAAIVSSGVSFYFQKRTLQSEKLMSLRMESVKEYSATADKAVELIEHIDANLRNINPEEIDSDRTIRDPVAAQRRQETIRMLNDLGDLAFKLPYQMRIVLIVAKNHYGVLFWNDSVPTSEQQKLKTENLTANSFQIAFKIATENFVTEGEPRHSELSSLLR